MNETDLMTAVLGDGSDICLSGGADGSDLQWGMCAGMAGHKVIHWSYEGHKTQAPEVEVVKLSADQLAKADPYVKEAAKQLKKSVPYKPWVKPLIQRNWYQVAQSQALYAVCDMQADANGNLTPQGGTAWAITMFMQRQDVNHKMYIFDQHMDGWYYWVDGIDKWAFCSRDTANTIPFPPKPSGIWTGIGTRELATNGKDAIRTLLGYVKPQI